MELIWNEETHGSAMEKMKKKRWSRLQKSYKSFLDAGKTERECVTELIRQAEAAGYVSMEKKLASGEKIQAGDKVYSVAMNKILAFFHIGQEPLEKGMNILGAHIDSPRIDIKQNPLYEEADMAYLDTHYYGGVKKISVGCASSCHPWCDCQKKTVQL